MSSFHSIKLPLCEYMSSFLFLLGGVYVYVVVVACGCIIYRSFGSVVRGEVCK